MSTTCGWCVRAGFDECFCSKSDVEAAWAEERARLRPLLERALTAATTAGIDLDLATDLRRELGITE